MYTDEATIRAKLREFCDKHTARDGKPSQSKAAKALGVTAAQLSLTLNGKTNVIPARILKKLGYKAVVAYAPAGSKKAKKTAKPLSEHNKAFKNAGAAAKKRAAKKAPTRRSTTPEQRAAMRQARSGADKATVKRTTVHPTSPPVEDSDTLLRTHVTNETVPVQEKPRSVRKTPAVATFIDLGAED